MNILYVCTGNIFRSMSAEYLTKTYIQEQNITNLHISSAGTVASLQEPFPTTVERLWYYNTDPTPHIQRRITREILEDQDVVICMAEHHRTVVRELGYDAVLFNEIAYNKTEDLMDDTEYQEKYGIQDDLTPYIIKTVNYIHDAIPTIIENIKKKISYSNYTIS